MDWRRGFLIPLVPAGRVLVPLALFHFQALGKWGRQDEEKRLSSLIASLPGLCLEKQLEGAHAPPSGSLWASEESDSQNGDETVECGPRARFVGLPVNGTGAQGETWGRQEELKGKESNSWAQDEEE